MFSYSTALILGGIAGIVVTILLYIKVMPRKLDGAFTNPFFQKLHDFFHFKKLYLEEVLKFLYVLATVVVICMGVFMLLSYYEQYQWGYYDSYTTRESMAGYGLLTIVVGPIVLRLIYEVSMMFILLVKNTIEINNKLSQSKATPNEPSVPVNTCPVCPSCGSAQEEGASFCVVCGQKL